MALAIVLSTLFPSELKWSGFFRFFDEQVFLKDLVGKEKKKVREAKLARKKALEDMSKDLIEGFQNMKFYKFYPAKSDKYPDISEMKVCWVIIPSVVFRSLG